MPAKFYSTTLSSSTGDLLHKLGFSNQPSYDRKLEIERNMHHLQQWLDDDTGYEIHATTGPFPPPPPPEDTIMGRPAVLIASTGSIRKKRRRMATTRAARSSKVDSSGGSMSSGSMRSETSSLNTNVDTLEFFPMFVSSEPTALEVEAEIVDEQNEEEKRDEEDEVSKQAGSLGTFGRLWRVIWRG